MERIGNQIKVVLLGDSGVGKSSILEQFLQTTFKTNVESTIGASFKAKEININGFTIKLNIWDTAGQERYQSLTKMYCRGAEAVILVYDITKKETFENLKKWYQIVLDLGHENTMFVVVGNKEDLVNQEVISLNEAKEFTEKIKAFYKKTSAMTNFGVEELFNTIASNLQNKSIKSRPMSVKLETGSEMVSKKKSCC